METLAQKTLRTISKNHLIRAGDKVLVGISGGADSTTLLAVFNDLRAQISFGLHAAHINHRLREGADVDQRFVENLCIKQNVPLTAKILDLKKKIGQGGSVEEIAREARRKALISIAKKTHCNIIALAHHRDDLAETVLLRILRGTGLQGLQAILPKRELDGMVFIRPFIDSNRADIIKYLNQKKICFRNDPTNQQSHFFRNKIRAKLLPLLKKSYQANIQEILCNLAFTAADDYEYLRQQTLKIFSKITTQKISGKVLTFDLTKFQRQHTSIKRMVLRFAYESIKRDTAALTLKHLNEIEDMASKRPAGSIVDLPHNIFVMKKNKSLRFEKKFANA